jgi:uncharacterized protein YutD
MIHIQGFHYELKLEFRNGWNQEAFRNRFNAEVLEKYDYIFGDWGYNQLRLKGFFDNKNKNSPNDSKIGYLDEYIQEFCNFGSPYFLLKKVNEKDII